MAEAIPEGEVQNYEQFRDAFSDTIIERLCKPQKKAKRKKFKAETRGSITQSSEKQEPDETTDEQAPQDAESLSEFTDYISALAFNSLPVELRNITHRIWADNPTLKDTYNLPLTTSDIATHILPTLDPDIASSLTAYSIIRPPAEDMTTLLAPVLTSYLTTITTPPPIPSATRAEACEICERDWVPLTYHHLIPRAVHDKVVRRGWHRREDLQSVAWLCRACHSFVHRLAGNEELAREYFTVERLMGREEVVAFASWVGRVRWKAR